jgi:glycosyltransferase involved in cell wall biosynthesis
LNKEDYEKQGKLGIIQNRESVQDVIDTYLGFRRLIQRMAYCSEYDGSDLLEIMNELGVNVKELIWTINSATFNSAEAIEKVKGNPGAISVGLSTYTPKHKYQDVRLDFIICSNDAQELDEALYYISRLYIPEGVEIDVLSIEDAQSMCAGYNEGMRASSAKYKVYMHHDVRIIERNFIPMLIDTFMEHEDAGIIGMIGTNGFPKDGIMWNIERFGSVWDTHIHETTEIRLYPSKNDVEVMLCDGLLLATQYDVPWRDDIFDGWDFYDASQCMEFKRKGYKVIVPYQDSSWCIHDCGFLNFKQYDHYKDLFLAEYTGV